MSSYVTIKSYPNGLKVFLSEECSFDDLKNELSEKFSASKNFFKDSKIAVSFEERLLSFDEEKELVSIMEQAGALTVMYIIGKDEETSAAFSKAVEHPMNGDLDFSYFGKLYTSSLKKGEHIEIESGVVILGDVEPGASIIAKGSIVILGGLYGSATVSNDEDLASEYFIAANDISAERIKICGKKYISHEKAKWLIKPKMQSKIAYVVNDEIVLENISSDVLSTVCKKIEEC